MECQVCKERSSIGYCSDSRVLVCEVCSATCHHCHGLVRREGANVSTSSGHIYCAACWKERQERRDARKKRRETPPPSAATDDTSFASLMDREHDSGGAVMPQVSSEGEDESGFDDEDHSVLTASAWKPPPPWKLSFQAGIIGLVGIIIVLIFPGFHRVVLPFGLVVLTPLVLLVPAAIAIMWGALGIAQRDYQSDMTRCILGIGAAALTIMLCLHALSSPPAVRAYDNVEYTRDTMTPQELGVWRQQMLDKHRR
jgi:hypothetical protein